MDVSPTNNGNQSQPSRSCNCEGGKCGCESGKCGCRTGDCDGKGCPCQAQCDCEPGRCECKKTRTFSGASS
jgi:hypothetical protein